MAWTKGFRSSRLRPGGSESGFEGEAAERAAAGVQTVGIRVRRVRCGYHPKTQVQKANLGHLQAGLESISERPR